MTDKKAQEHTFLKNGKVFYNMISEERIRELIREEIAEMNSPYDWHEDHGLSPGEPWTWKDEEN